MKKFMVVVMLLPLMVLSQNPTEIPRPTEVPIDYTGEDLFINEFYDFDGDGSKDVCVSYFKSGATPQWYLQFYSYSKKQDIAIIPLNEFQRCKFADIDNDNTTEMIVVYTSPDKKRLIYEITTAIGIKKKLP